MAEDGSLKFDTKINMEGFESGISTLTKAVDRLTGVIEKLSGRLITQLNGAGTAAESTSEQVGTIGEAAENSEAKVKSLREQMDAISVHTMEKNPTESTTSLPASTPVSPVSMHYDPKAMAAVFGEAASEIQTYAQAVEQYGNQAGSAMNSAEEKIAEAAKSGTEKAQVSFASMKDMVLNAFQDIPYILGKVPKAVARELSKIPGIVKRVFSAATRTVSDFGKALGGKLSDSIKQAAARLKGLGKTSNGVSKSILKLSNMFKLMLIRMAMRAAIQGVKKGMENLVQYSGDANRGMSSLMSSMTYLKNSFAATFAPVLTTVAPVLNTLINLLSTAAGYLNQFFSALSGSSVFVRAKKVNEDYAKSLKGIGGAAAKAGKEAKKALAPFDELNMIADSKGTGSGAEGGGTDPSGMFETVRIDKGISDFANKLKQLFSAEDWSGIGSLIGEQINDAVQRFTDYIHWDNIGAKITEFLSAFTTLFNTLVSKIDWYGIGIMMGTGINTLANALYLLLTQIDWTFLGAAIARGVNGMVATVDWDLVGRTIGAYFQAQISSLYGFVSTADWPAIGRAVGDSLNGVAGQIDWAMLGQLLAEGLSGAFAVLGNLATTFDWTGFGSSLALGVSTFFKDFDWAGAGTAISDIVKGLLDALITFIKQTDWKAFGEGVATSLENIDWNGIVSRLFEVIGAALGGFAAFLGGLLADGVEAAKEYFKGKIDECGGNIVDGIFKGIIDGLKGIGNWMVTNVFKPFIGAFKDAFGIHSPSTAMAEMGQYLWDGFCNGIKKFFSNPVSFIRQHITTPFLNGIRGLLGIHSPSTVLAGIGRNTVEGFNNGMASMLGSSVGAAKKWLDKVVTVFDGAGIGIPIGLNMPDAASCLPRMASGSIVPPRAGEAASARGGKSQDGDGGLLAAFEEMLDGFKGAGGGNITIPVYLDSVKIYQTMIKNNQQAEQAAGSNLLTE